MDKYKKLKAVQGLIVSLDEQIYRMEQFHKEEFSQAVEEKVIDQYYSAVTELLLAISKPVPTPLPTKEEDTNVG
jgi:hypothetical protein